MSEIELVEFYPFYVSKHMIKGTVHVYHAGFDMDLRGLTFTRGKYRSSVVFPCGFGIDPESKEVVRYPFVEFTNQNTKKRIRSEVLVLMEDFLKDWVPPKGLPSSMQQAKKQFEVIKTNGKRRLTRVV